MWPIVLRFLHERRILAALVLTACIAGSALANAQNLVVEAPPPRLAQPGAYVTLVFKVRSAAATTAAVEAVSQLDWTLLAPPRTLRLAARETVPVAVTVAVPAFATPLQPDTVKLTVLASGQEETASVQVQVARHVAAQLSAPHEAPANGDLPVTVRNTGNATFTATVQLTTQTGVVASHKLTVAAGGDATTTFRLGRVATYQVRLFLEGQQVTLQTVRTIVFGPPVPPPQVLAGSAQADVDSSGLVHAGVSLRGPLSDHVGVTLDARADTPLRSYGRLSGPAFSVSLGYRQRNPFGLPAGSDFGVSAGATLGDFGVDGELGWVASDQFQGTLSTSYVRPSDDTTIAGSVGMRAGTPTVTGSLSGSFANGTASLVAGYDGVALGGAFTMTARDRSGHYRVTARAADLLSSYARFDARFDYNSKRLATYLDTTVPIGRDAQTVAEGGVTTRLAHVGTGTLQGAVQIGTPLSELTVGYLPAATGTVRPSLSLGTLYRPLDLGWGVLADAGLWLGAPSQSPDSASLDFRARYFPGTDALRGRLGVHAQHAMGAWTLYGASGWDFGTGSVDAGLGVIYDLAAWTLQLDTTGSYTPADPSPLGATVRVEARYAFDLSVPTSIVRAFGGWYQGHLTVHVAEGQKGLDGATIAVGRYRLKADRDGLVKVNLPPGTYPVSVDLTRLPLDLQPVGPTEATVTLAAGDTRSVSFRLRRTAALSGRVLVDSNADGTPDTPLRGVRATLTITDANGASRSVKSGADGAFGVRGLPPGRTRVSFDRGPLGSTVVGSGERTVTLVPGTTRHLQLLVQPAMAHATTFSNTGLHIRSIEPEVPRAPTGSSPLVTIRVAGHPSGVTVSLSSRTMAATKTATGTWLARLPVPSTARGLLSFKVTAKTADRRATRSGQLIVDDSVPLITVQALSAARPGGSVRVHVHTLFAASGVSAALDAGPTVPLTQSSPGIWTGAVPVPATTNAKTLTLRVLASRSGTKSIAATTPVRVQQQ